MKSELRAACQAALKLFQPGRAMNHFDWKRSFLNAADIKQLNEVPIQLHKAIANTEHMNENQGRVLQFIQQIPAQATAIRHSPSMPDQDVRILRAKLIMEEAVETITLGLGLDIRIIKVADPDDVSAG